MASTPSIVTCAVPELGELGSLVSPVPMIVNGCPSRSGAGNTPVTDGWVRVTAFLPTYSAADTLVSPSSVSGMIGRPSPLGLRNWETK